MNTPRLILPVCLLLLAHVSSPAQARRASSSFDVRSFDLSVERLPPYYAGHSLAGLARVLPGWKWGARKSEFETTVEYKRRMDRERQKPLLGGLRFDSLLAFSFGLGGGAVEAGPYLLMAGYTRALLSAEYDADAGVMKVNAGFTRAPFVAADGGNCYQAFWTRVGGKPESYVARNFLGRRVRVRVYQEDEYYLGLCAPARDSAVGLRARVPGITADGTFGSIDATLTMGSKEAREKKDYLRALVIGRLDGNPYERTFERVTPTFSKPVEEKTTGHYVKIIPQEVWIYDLSTGWVYAKVATK
jgi:hypothetical protein